MLKFAIVKVRENEETLVRWRNSKDEAMRSGAEYFEDIPKGEGTVSVEEVELDPRGQWIGGRRRIHYVWY